ncbi:MAG: GTPase Era [Pseudomonadota bacterium]
MTERCGYVALLGRPNVGKSTLLNHVLKQKLAITSRKPQTTRKTLLGIDTDPAANCQAIYVDTPGIHDHAHRALNKFMVSQAVATLQDVDLRVLLIEAGRWTAGDEHVLNLLRESPGRNFAVLSKVDLLENKETLLPAMQQVGDTALFEEIVPLSALKNEGVEAFRQLVFGALPDNPHLFADDQITDQTERQIVAEMVREKVMRQLGDELPHSTGVVVEAFTEEPELVTIHADIYVERQGQKRIVIGQQGQRLKSIGQEARKDIEALLGIKVMLHLWVKVRKDWTNKASGLQRLGYE